MDIKKLIDNAEQVKNKKGIITQKKVKILRYEELGFEEPYVVIKRPTLSEIASITEHAGDDLHAIALTMVAPDLANKELQEVYGVNNRKALLSKLFTEEEQTELSMVVASMLSIRNKTQIIDEVKN